MSTAFCLPQTQTTPLSGNNVVQIEPPNNEIHYQATAPDSATSKPLLVDSPTSSPTLGTRVGMEFYNAESVNVFEVSTDPNFKYGQGRPVKPGTSYIVNIGPATVTKHYILSQSGTTSDCRISEVGLT